MTVIHPELQSLLLPNDSPEELVNLISAWKKDFPGESHLQMTLRNDLVRAEWLRRRAQYIFNQIQLELYATGLPFEFWNPITQKHFRFFEKHAQRAQNEFRKALQFLAKFHPPPNSTKKPEETLKPKLNLNPDLTGKLPFEQTVYLEKDAAGLWSHRHAPPNSRFTELHPENRFCEVVRRFLVKESELPGQYQWVNIHAGERYRTTSATLIRYTPEEFIKILAEEAETGKLADGPRIKYSRYEDCDPIETLDPTQPQP